MTEPAGMVWSPLAFTPTPPEYPAGKKTDSGVTNIRNAGSPYWRPWLGVEKRCLVPFTSFAEPNNGTFGRGKPWLKTIPGKGFFVIFCLYGPTKAFYDQTWMPDDIAKSN
jgi:putative SOS response-associated peptidase YedK